MRLNRYQKLAMKTACYRNKRWRVSKELVYVILALAGESGEVANQLKKCLRAGKPVDRKKMVGELGGILWYVAAAATELKTNLRHVAETNLRTLDKRKQKNDIAALTHKIES